MFAGKELYSLFEYISSPFVNLWGPSATDSENEFDPAQKLQREMMEAIQNRDPYVVEKLIDSNWSILEKNKQLLLGRVKGDRRLSLTGTEMRTFTTLSPPPNEEDQCHSIFLQAIESNNVEIVSIFFDVLERKRWILPKFTGFEDIRNLIAEREEEENEEGKIPIDRNALPPIQPSVFHISSEKGHTRILKYLLRKLAENSRVLLNYSSILTQSGSSDSENENAASATSTTMSVLNAFDHRGKTCLMLAAENGHADAVSLLLLQRALDSKIEPPRISSMSSSAFDVQYQQTYQPYNALFRAVLNKRREVIDVFVKQQWASLDIHNSDGSTPLIELIKNGGDEEMIMHLLSLNNVNVDPYSSTLYNSTTNIKITVIEDEEKRKKREATPSESLPSFSSAALSSTSSQKASSKKSKVMNVNFNDRRGVSPLHYAILFGNASLISLLAFYQVQLNQLDMNDRSPLMYAVMLASGFPISEILHADGKEFLKHNDDGCAHHPDLKKTEKEQNEESTEDPTKNEMNQSDHMKIAFLMSRKAKWDLKDKFGKTAMDYARGSIISLLKEYIPTQ